MDKLRDFLQSWPGRIVMLLCLSPMVFLGLDGYFHAGRLSDNDAVKVGERTISLQALQQEFQNRRATLLETEDESTINDTALLAQTLETMINRTLLEEQSAKLGMQVSDTAITERLQNEPAFQDANGNFSNELFASFLQNRGLTKNDLFASQRREINLRTILNAILNNVIYPASQVSRLIDLQLESRPVQLQRLPWQDYATQVTVSDSEIAAYYDAHREALISPEQVDLQYLVLPDAQTVSAPTTAELQAIYESDYKGDKQIAQILLDDNPETLRKVQEELQAGKDFMAVAKQYSKDPTAIELGTYNPAVFGTAGDKVSQALNNVAVGQVSAPVTSDFGLHIFKVTAVNPAPSFASVKDKLSAQALANKQAQARIERVNRINNLVADGYTLTDIAKELNLTVQQLPNYSADSTVLAYPVLHKVAFAPDNQGVVSSDIKLDDSTVWLQPSNYRESTPMTLEQARDTIKQRLTQQKASELAFKVAEQQATALNAGNDSEKAQLTDIGVVSRQSNVLTEAERASLFIHPVTTGENVAWAVLTDTGASLLLGGTIQTETQERMPSAQKTAAAMMMKNVAGQDYLEDYLRYLREEVHEVQTNDELLKTL